MVDRSKDKPEHTQTTLSCRYPVLPDPKTLKRFGNLSENNQSQAPEKATQVVLKCTWRHQPFFTGSGGLVDTRGTARLVSKAQCKGSLMAAKKPR